MSHEDGDLLNHTALLDGFYTRVYPSSAELQRELGWAVAEDQLHAIVAELRDEVDLLGVEAEILERFAAPAAGPAEPLAEDPTASLPGLGGPPKRGPGADLAGLREGLAARAAPEPCTARRGKHYQRKTDEATGRYVRLADKTAMLAKEEERLLGIAKGDEAAAGQLRGHLIATAEEAARRAKELRLQRRVFAREVLACENPQLDEGSLIESLLAGSELPGASAEALLRYLEREQVSHGRYLDKLEMQCRATEQDIARALHRLRQHQIAGETFRPVDFEQLGIENEQFNERAEQKSAELVKLKGASTRTVQALNATTDALNDLVAEQSQLKKEYKSRCEYLARCTKEMSSVAKEVVVAEKKNEAIRAKHESVRAPTIEEYIAQRAELFELQKTEKNWQRKVEIAQGQMQDLRRRVAKLKVQRSAALAYAVEQQNRRENNLKARARNFRQASLKYPPLALDQQSTTLFDIADGVDGSCAPPPDEPLVANSKSLLNAKRQTRK